MTMLAQHPVRQCAVSQQLDRAVEVPFQPFGVDACGRVIVQCFVHAGDVLYLLQHRPDVMADEDDGAVAVDLRQQLVEADFLELSPERTTSRTEMGKERSIELYCGR